MATRQRLEQALQNAHAAGDTQAAKAFADAIRAGQFDDAEKPAEQAQPKVDDMYVRPDFYYKPNIMIFCDGTPHDDESIKMDDLAKRSALKNAGYQVLTWYYKDDLNEFVSKRPDLFKKIK